MLAGQKLEVWFGEMAGEPSCPALEGNGTFWGQLGP